MSDQHLFNTNLGSSGEAHLCQLLLSAQGSIVLMLKLVQLGSQLVLGLDSLGVSLDGSGVLLFQAIRRPEIDELFITACLIETIRRLTLEVWCSAFSACATSFRACLTALSSCLASMISPMQIEDQDTVENERK